MRMGVLNDCLKTILNAERAGKRQVIIHPISKIVVKVLKIMQKKGYIGEFEIIDDHRAKKAVVDLLGRLNKCGDIGYRKDYYESTSLAFSWICHIHHHLWPDGPQPNEEEENWRKSVRIFLLMAK
jgi:Ribosomal protein S8